MVVENASCHIHETQGLMYIGIRRVETQQEVLRANDQIRDVVHKLGVEMMEVNSEISRCVVDELLIGEDLLLKRNGRTRRMTYGRTSGGFLWVPRPLQTKTSGNRIVRQEGKGAKEAKNEMEKGQDKHGVHEYAWWKK